MGSSLTPPPTCEPLDHRHWNGHDLGILQPPSSVLPPPCDIRSTLDVGRWDRNHHRASLRPSFCAIGLGDQVRDHTGRVTTYARREIPPPSATKTSPRRRRPCLPSAESRGPLATAIQVFPPFL
ncbi:hypothetical protein BDA96_10G257900 [Sorghum bicolor]|uniref:Uncharacterized protein n=2 Tax=Sorghum bicolor TaxID=4558 RepID=A0A921Q796_SORBI|nr:hypothetical protein BDA96_10G257900 [Sorghum bicolor]OQU91832.1 hypothetical protein SORBI_3001G253750 [Sorghum bicolor]